MSLIRIIPFAALAMILQPERMINMDKFPLMVQRQTRTAFDDLESKFQVCPERAEWDTKNKVGLDRAAATSQVVMIGIFHGEIQGDPEDGQFVARLLREYKSQGYNHLALECPASLSASLNKNNYAPAQAIYKSHWTEFGPAIVRARELSIPILCYDVEPNWDGSDAEREKIQYETIVREIFHQDPLAKIVVYCGLVHAFADYTSGTKYSYNKQCRCIYKGTNYLYD